MSNPVSVRYFAFAFVLGISACAPLPERFLDKPAIRGYDGPPEKYNESRLTGTFPKLDELGCKGPEEPVPDSPWYNGRLPSKRCLNTTGRLKPFSFKQEWAWNKKGKEEPPRMCIAFSGGGLRSAAFSFGVISALAKNGDLDRADIISAVSGGSYAVSAMYAHHFERYRKYAGLPVNLKTFVKENFTDEDLVRFGKFIPRNGLGKWIGDSLSTESVLENFWENGIFGRHSNTSDTAINYRERIRENFHQGSAITLPALAAHSKKHGLPMLIVVGTAHLVEDGENADHYPLSDIVFEFTPINYGSDALGRFPYVKGKCDDRIDSNDRPLCLDDAVAISGAAADSTLVGGTLGRKLLSGLNVDLGWNIANPMLTDAERDSRKWIPFPFYNDKWYTRGIEGTHFWVTDGGHSDNLGLFSLIRRDCEKVIVVDGEHDPNYEFESYSKLKKRLKEQLGINLSVAPIDDELDKLEKIRYVYEHQGYVERETYLNDEAISKRRRLNMTAANPVLTGIASWVPYPKRSGVISVTYIKLSNPEVNKRECKQLMKSACGKEQCNDLKDDNDRLKVLEDMERNGDQNMVLKGYACLSNARNSNKILKGTFPHESTVDLEYSEMQTRAYLERAREIVAKCKDVTHHNSCFVAGTP